MCPIWNGKFESYAKDSIYFRMQWKTEAYGEDGAKEVLQNTYVKDKNAYPLVALAANDVTYIAPKGRWKHPSDNSMVSSIGILLTVAGVGSIVNSSFAENKGDLVLAGSVELVSGFILAFAGERPTYYLGETLAAEKEKTLWSIQ